MTLTSVISEAKRSRRPWLAATPPATTRVLTGYFSKAFLVLAMRECLIRLLETRFQRSALERLSPFARHYGAD